jgi:hypothetical protein
LINSAAPGEMSNLFADLAFGLGLLVLLLGGVHGMLRPRQRWFTWTALLALFAPPLFLVLKTSYRYVEGTARLRWPSNEPRYREFENLDPKYRAFVRYGHPGLWWRAVSGIEQYTFTILFDLFGPMRGSYLGPYPCRDGVRVRMAHVQPSATARSLADGFELDGQTIQVPAPALARALADASAIQANGSRLLAVALVTECCLIIGYWDRRWYHAELVDLSGFGWFAHYVFPLSLKEFGKRVGMSVANLCDIEKGRKGVSPEKAEQIARAIGVPAALLIRSAIEESLRAAGLEYSVEVKPAA